MVRFLVLAVCSLVVAAPVAAAEDAATAAPIAAAPAPAQDKMVCQRVEETGSRGYKKVCQTDAQWRAQQERDKRNVSERDRSDR